MSRMDTDVRVWMALGVRHPLGAAAWSSVRAELVKVNKRKRPRRDPDFDADEQMEHAFSKGGRVLSARSPAAFLRRLAEHFVLSLVKKDIRQEKSDEELVFVLPTSSAPLGTDDISEFSDEEIRIRVNKIVAKMEPQQKLVFASWIKVAFSRKAKVDRPCRPIVRQLKSEGVNIAWATVNQYLRKTLLLLKSELEFIGFQDQVKILILLEMQCSRDPVLS